MERRGFDVSSLISSSLNSPYQYFLALCKSSLKPFNRKCKGPFSVALHPGAMKAGPIKLCKPRAVAGAAAGRGSGRSCRLETEVQPWRWPVPGRLCQAAPAHQHDPHLPAHHTGFCCPGLQASGPHSKLVERDSTAGSRHIIQCPVFQKIQTASGHSVFSSLGSSQC